MFCCSASPPLGDREEHVADFLQKAARRLRTQHVRAEQFLQDAQEAHLQAVQCARQSNRIGARAYLMKEKRLMREYELQLKQWETMDTAMMTLRRAMDNKDMGQQLASGNMLLADLLRTTHVDEAVDAFRDHAAATAVASNELALPLASQPEDEVNEEEIDDLMALSVAAQLPPAPAANLAFVPPKGRERTIVPE